MSAQKLTVGLANIYDAKLFPTQISHFIHVSLANGTPQNCFPLKSGTLSMFPSEMVRLKIVSPLKSANFIDVSLANGTSQNCFPLKLAILSMFPSQMVRLEIVCHSNQPFYPCFPRKWYVLKLFPTQISHFIHVSLANGTP